MMANLTSAGTLHSVLAMSGIATMTVSAIGYILIARNRPNPEQGSAAAGAIQHNGVPS
jgi:hypothetical protein